MNEQLQQAGSQDNKGRVELQGLRSEFKCQEEAIKMQSNRNLAL